MKNSIRRMSSEDLKILAKVIDDLNNIKVYGLKAEAYNNGLRDEVFEKRAVKERLEMPSPEEFLKKRRMPETFEELHDLIKGYIRAINHNDVEILDEIEYECAKVYEHGNAFHNEIESYQAGYFIEDLHHVLDCYLPNEEMYLVKIYDIPEITISFGEEDTAREFISYYTGPCTLLKEEGVLLQEIDSF